MLMTSLLPILILLLSPFIVFSNTLIITVWIRFKRLQTPSNAFIASLAMADLGFGLFLPAAVALELSFSSTTPCSSSAGERENFTRTSSGSSEDCSNMTLGIISFAILLSFCSASLLSITLIAVDRFTSVSQPLRYNHFLTMSTVHKVVSSCWIYAVSIGLAVPIMLLSRNEEWPSWRGDLILGWIAVFLYIPCLTFTLVSYGYIYVIARNHARAIYSVEISLHNGSSNEVTDRATLGHTNRYGLTLALILSSIILSWSPILCLALYDTLSFHRGVEQELFENVGDYPATTTAAVATANGSKRYDMLLKNPQWRMMASLPLILSSLINPWLYGYRSTEMRVAVIKLLGWIATKLTGRPSVEIMYSYHKGDLTSCASNVRLLGLSPTQTTVQCCSPSPNVDRKLSNLSIHLMICDNNQVSSL